MSYFPAFAKSLLRLLGYAIVNRRSGSRYSYFACAEKVGHESRPIPKTEALPRSFQDKRLPQFGVNHIGKFLFSFSPGSVLFQGFSPEYWFRVHWKTPFSGREDDTPPNGPRSLSLTCDIIASRVPLTPPKFFFGLISISIKSLDFPRFFIPYLRRFWTLGTSNSPSPNRRITMKSDEVECTGEC